MLIHGAGERHRSSRPVGCAAEVCAGRGLGLWELERGWRWCRSSHTAARRGHGRRLAEPAATICVGAGVAFARVGIVGFDGLIDLQSLRHYGLPEAAPAVLNGTPPLPQSGQREFAAEVYWDLPSLAQGATSLLDVMVSVARAGDLATASLVSSTRFIELDAAVWSNNTVRVMARNISGAAFDLASATLSVGVVKRRVP